MYNSGILEEPVTFDLGKNQRFSSKIFVTVWNPNLESTECCLQEVWARVSGPPGSTFTPTRSDLHGTAHHLSPWPNASRARKVPFGTAFETAQGHVIGWAPREWRHVLIRDAWGKGRPSQAAAPQRSKQRLRQRPSTAPDAIAQLAAPPYSCTFHGLHKINKDGTTLSTGPKWHYLSGGCDSLTSNNSQHYDSYVQSPISCTSCKQ